MDNREIIQNSIDYIENNLKTDIEPRELADSAGFSLWHYYRVFSSLVGMPVMQYVVKRRLLGAVYEISLGVKIADVSLDYGFDTYSGFFKAFRREFGCSPTAFIKNSRVKKPCKIDLTKENHIMITHKKVSLTLADRNLQNEKISDTRSENAFFVGDKYVIKFTENLSALKNQIFISKELEKSGIMAVSPVPTADGREYVQSGEIYSCLMNRIDGEPITADENNAEAIGESIGNLHIALAKLNSESFNDNNLLAALKNWALPGTKDYFSAEKPFLDKFINDFEQLYGALPRQIVHRDPNPSNIIKCGDKFGFVDFDLTEKNVRIYDPCYAATAVLSEHIDEKEKWIGIYKKIITGYDRIAKLTENEKKAVPYVVIANQLICVKYFSEQEKYSDIFGVNLKMTRWLIGNFNILNI